MFFSKIEINLLRCLIRCVFLRLAANGGGKTTLIRLLANLIPGQEQIIGSHLSVSYKPQKIAPKFQGTVKELLQTKIPTALTHSQFQSDVSNPLKISELFDLNVLDLSGGQLQRVAIILCLGKPADIYLIDEPSSYLDSEQRIIVSKVIKRFIVNSHKTAFVVEQDFIMATYLADKVIVFSGQPGISTIANKPVSLDVGMNAFLKDLGITIRKDKVSKRPRINKTDSVIEKEQIASGKYYQTV